MPKLLIVEDNADNRDLLARRLMRQGYEVTLAEDGQEGLDLAIRDHPDLILLDMSLPILDGWEVARRLKLNPGTNAIPIIALTAHAMVEDRERCFAAGCDDFDTKPVDFARLSAKIAAFLTVVEAAT